MGVESSTDLSPRARAVEAVMRPLLDLFEAGCGVRAAFFATVRGDGHEARYAYARDGGLVETVRPHGPALHAARPVASTAPLRGSAPLRVGGQAIGTLEVACLSGQPLPAAGPTLLEACAQVLAAQLAPPATPRAATADASDLALLDPLTGLPNRPALVLELERMLARAQRDDMAVFVVCVGLAGADAARHSLVFDQRIVELGACLSDSVRGGDLVARTGHHEFAIAGSIPRMTAEASAAVVLERLNARCAQPSSTAPALRARVDMGFALARIGEFDAQALLAEAETSLLR